MNQDDLQQRLKQLAAEAPPDQRERLEKLMAHIADSQREVDAMLEREMENQKRRDEESGSLRARVEAASQVRKDIEQGFAKAFEEQNAILERIVSG
jgi:hypothetical protein